MRDLYKGLFLHKRIDPVWNRPSNDDRHEPARTGSISDGIDKRCIICYNRVMSENSTPDPKHISELLAASVSAQPDEERARATTETDLRSEIDGLTDGIADIQEQMARTGHQDLPAKLDESTSDSIQAHHELDDLKGDNSW